MKIKRILIANRGEIALRIISTLKKLKIQSIAIFSEADRADRHVCEADEACSLGEGSLEQTWLNIPLIIDIAKQSGADAIHPGYGFLSENATFARACEDAGIIFIGPESHVIEKMGSKLVAAQYAKKAGIPLLPRLEGSPDYLVNNAASLGFPLLVKAAAGGGGKGMIRIDRPEMLKDAVYTASQQAKRYFADEKVYVEKYVENPRHIEVQILADQHGNVIHLLERECTLQRNHQKVVEEAPSVTLNAKVRKALHESAVSLAKTVGYTNAGTVEYIMDENLQFYFLEMNTRIQVEHPVTEMITGVDLVEEQIKVAENKPLGMKQNDIKARGHAIEMRLYAEDPSQNFRPSAGFIKKILFPKTKGLRIDSAIAESGFVHPSFDAMIAKVVFHDKDRKSAIHGIKNTLSQILVHGIKTNLNLLSSIAGSRLYAGNNISTHTISRNLKKWSVPTSDAEKNTLVAALFLWLERYSHLSEGNSWRMAGKEIIKINGLEKNVFYYPKGEKGIVITMDGETFSFENITVNENKITVSWNNFNENVVFNYSQHDALFLTDKNQYHVRLAEVVPVPKLSSNGLPSRIPDLKASLFGKVLRINVVEKQKVRNGDPLMVLESMKMENTILAPGDTIISKLNVKVGDQVSDGQTLIFFEA
ncbi:MAG: ATP-grasp domain-containing protein [Bacteroidetes bacterium]|nr:MAG: ATP-grasp domain-containing protein [Bacteroidota bacterium]